MAKLTPISHLDDCLSNKQLLKYIQGETDPLTTRRIELHLTDCPLCGDAVEGLLLAAPKENLPKDFEELDARIEKKYPPQVKPFPLWQRLAAAASVLLVVGLTAYSLWNWNNAKIQDTPSPSIAQTETSSEKDAESTKTSPTPPSDEVVAQDKNQAEQVPPPKEELLDKSQAKSPNITSNVEATPPSLPNESQKITSGKPEAEGYALHELQEKPSIKPSSPTVSPLKNSPNTTLAPIAAAPSKKTDSSPKKDVREEKLESEALKEDIGVSQEEYIADNVVPVAPAPATAATPAYDDFNNSGIKIPRTKSEEAKYNKDKKALSNTEKQKFYSSSHIQQLMQKKKYTEALSLLTPHLQMYPYDYEALYYKGICHQKKKQYELALQTLTKISEGELQYEEAQWEIANIYLLKKDTQNAQKALRGIQNQGGKYSPKATEKLNKK